MSTDDRDADRDDALLGGVRRRSARHRSWLRDGEPTLVRQFARVGVLGWLVVVPALLGAWLGHLIDAKLGGGVFWTAPLLLVGLAIGCWSGWKWMHRP